MISLRLQLRLICFSLALPAVSAVANPANKASLSKHFGRFMDERARTCKLCHVADHAPDASSLDDFPHNAFGAAILAAGEQLQKESKDDAMPARMAVVAEDDADGDGHSNLIEILLGSLPGNASDVPTAESLARTQSRLDAYQQHTNRYAWLPFKPVSPPKVPEIAGDWVRNPIDAFIALEHRRPGHSPRPEARPEQLLRRVYLNLIGLSPTPDELNRFKAEYSQDPTAYDRFVDQLLDHPAYGERWGRHWMDVWRYSDWAGYKDALRESQRHIWHWRDWIVESLNQDKGYDQMVMQMLAADEMHLDDELDLRATGYLARNYYTNRDQWMDNVVKHSSQAFLGVTLGCAKCHDHMTDPFKQTEYYSMRAVFENYDVRTDRVPGELDVAQNGIPRVYDKSIDAETYLFARGDERRPQKDAAIPPGTPSSLGGQMRITPVSLSSDASRPDGRPFVLDQLRRDALKKVGDAKHSSQRLAAQIAYAALVAELDLEAKELSGLPKDSDQWRESARQIVLLQRDAAKYGADWVLIQARQKQVAADAALQKADTSKNAAAIAKAKRAKAAADKLVKTATEDVKRTTEALTAELTTEFKPRKQNVYPSESSGRRLALAKWLVDRQNPLTARVAMNHIWLRHFGRAIVPTVNDFGAGGRAPKYPALLDWLAAELMCRHWSMKQMHRLIVTSATYRMSSTGDETNAVVDPDNEYLWRGNWQRMEGEIVRDNLLHLAGQLDTTFGGPDIDHALAETSPRRSIYLRHAHEKLVEFIQIFDGPAVSECYARETSVQPHQALALANSKLSNDAAQLVAKQIGESCHGDDHEFVEQAFLRVLSRPPTQDESKACLVFLENDDRSRRNLVLVLFNHNDFVTIR